jgi:2-iminobutanoate/2-iminopropanoate deaminase
MDHMKALVETAGSNMDCLLKVIVWLKDQAKQEEFDRIYRTYFSSQEALPARTRMQAGRRCDKHFLSVFWSSSLLEA